ncbi:MAG: hypothetical protein CMJ78_02935 [Planctomycetaceae bacterium]|nr:hypothetical protein [Planctomycetaceae bacterium]
MIILRIAGVFGLFAIPAVFLPFSVMNEMHGHLGLGEMPEAPIVNYLARSLAAFYAGLSAAMLVTACDIRRYRPLIKYWSWMLVVMGFVMLGVDVHAGLPLSWTVFEGPPAVVVGFVMLRLHAQIEDLKPEDLHVSET